MKLTKLTLGTQQRLFPRETTCYVIDERNFGLLLVLTADPSSQRHCDRECSVQDL